MWCEINNVPSRHDRMVDNTGSVHLLAGNKVPGDQHSEIVPDLHHLLVGSAPESEGGLASTAKDASTARSLAVSRGTIFSTFNVELVRLGRRSR